MVEFLRKRNHWLWKVYEYVTALIGWTFLVVLTAYFWNSIATLFEWPTIYADRSEWYYGLLGGCIAWIIKFDFFKYRMTRDPRDEPIRKWFSFKYAQRFKPSEVLIVPDGYAGDRKDLKLTKCPKCFVWHGFLNHEDSRQCEFYGCSQKVEAPK